MLATKHADVQSPGLVRAEREDLNLRDTHGEILVEEQLDEMTQREKRISR